MTPTFCNFRLTTLPENIGDLDKLKKLRLTGDKKIAIEQSIDSLMLPIFLTSLTTAVAFLSLVFAPLEYMTGYGVSIAIGICWAWTLSVTLLPSLIMLKAQILQVLLKLQMQC